MKTVTIKLYQFDELTGDAKERAKNWFIDVMQNNFPWQYEISKSIKAIENLFNISLCIDLYGSYYTERDTERDADFMPFARAVAYINNRFVFKEMPYRIREKYPRKKLALAVEKYEDTMLTGFCWDYVLFDAYKEFVNDAKRYGYKNYTLDDFFCILTRTAQKWLENEYDAIEDDEFIKDTCDANGWEFTEDGGKW